MKLTKQKLIASAIIIMATITVGFFGYSMKSSGINPDDAAKSVNASLGEAQKLCQKVEKDGADCKSINLDLMNTSRPGITDSDEYFYNFTYSAFNEDKSKSWGFSVNLFEDFRVESSAVHVSAERIE